MLGLAAEEPRTNKNARDFPRAHRANLVILNSGESLTYAFAAALSPFTAKLNRDL